MKKNKNICDICKKEKDDVEYIINPYVEDIQGIKIKEYICNECYNILIQDI